MIFASINLGEVMKVLMIFVVGAFVLSAVIDEFIDMFKRLADAGVEEQRKNLEKEQLRNQAEEEREKRRNQHSRKKGQKNGTEVIHEEVKGFYTGATQSNGYRNNRT